MVVKCAMAPYQSCVYAWVKATGTLRLDPLAPIAGRVRRGFAPLNNKCMELRKARPTPLTHGSMQTYPRVKCTPLSTRLWSVQGMALTHLPLLLPYECALQQCAAFRAVKSSALACVMCSNPCMRYRLTAFAIGQKRALKHTRSPCGACAATRT